ncbi:hypothetical protein [Aquipuribacter hungaricus]|uniref:Glycosyltransferase involved in cell wall biosynthesis n=1 Tax=Aquipuribacter hungaricus TaxID=545624 RepID=A0ABV7WJ13_9MICO
MTGVHHLVVGPPGHGVVRYAELLLAAAQVPPGEVHRLPRRVGADDLPALVAGLDGLDAAVVDPALGAADVAAGTAAGPTVAPARVHLHVTDHLLGRSPEEAMGVVEALARRGPVSLTLHDLPQASDGTPAARRRACYAGLAGAAVGVVVSSEHEAALLAAVTAGTPAAATPVRVVPLAVPPPGPSPVVAPDPGGQGGAPDAASPSAGASEADQGTPGRQVAVLGWVYPGKGHAEVLAALDGLPADVGLRVLGGASPGHEDLLDDLAGRARASGRPLVVDGWVDDAHLPALLRAVDVPVFAPRHVSASASLTAWLSAGRRPVTVRSRYTEEVDRRAPGGLLLVDDDPAALADGVRRALDDPTITRLDPGAPVGPGPAEAARLTLAGWPS